MGYMKENVYEDKGLQLYLNQMAKHPTLSREEEQRLGRLARDGDQEAINTLIQANLKFVVKIASGFQNRGLTLSELISEGYTGLIAAIQKFDPDKDVKLISYAVWYIKQRIHNAVSNQSSIIRVPVGKAGEASRIRAAQDRIYSETGRSADAEEVAEMLNINERSIERIEGQMPRTTSIDETYFSDDQSEYSALDFIPDESAGDPMREYTQNREHQKLYRAIGKLDSREAEIIRSYFGLNQKNETKNFAQIAETMGLSRERVRQIQKEALKKISAEMNPNEDFYVDDFIDKYDH
ncbi:MAG: RNA polymerase sigma factor RpoD/SigA [Candidatus Cloacimonetes bacterium]|nr:RNA polymerase sigma factor RpoD/SigA [Candidatus Cloacimonadota bacterium]